MRTITVLSTKYDASLHWCYQAYLLKEEAWGWLTYTPVGQPVESHKGSWLTLHPCLRWHWRSRWWDASLVWKENGEWLEWYCNIVTPPRFEEGALRFHDLDLDVVWHYERGIVIADADEFESHAVQMSYPTSLIQRVWDTAQRVRRMMHDGERRFNEDPYTLRHEREMAEWHVPLT